MPVCPRTRLAAAHPRLALTALAIASGLAASSAYAQTEAKSETSGTAAVDADGVNTMTRVTVTARKRKEVMLDVPISIQALSERELRSSGITDVKELGEQTGFNFSSAQGSGATGRAFGVVTFRGLQSELNFPWENSGGVFVDGIFISGGVSTINMADLSRVEVLKGPQNAFFGRSTFGGAVNFITKVPGTAFAGTVNSTVNHLGAIDMDTSVEGGLVGDVLRGRLTIGGRNKPALARTTDGGDLGAEQSKFVSGTLYFTPNEDVWVRLRGQYQRDEDSQPMLGYIPAGNTTSCVGKTFNGLTAARTPVTFTPSVPYFCGKAPSYDDVGPGVFDANTALPAGVVAAMVNNSLGDPFLAKSPRLDHTGMVRTTTRVSAQMGVTLPQDMDLAFNAGYNESASNSIYDLDRTKVANFLAQQTNPTRDLTLDARLSTDSKAALRGLVGVSYFKSSYQLSQIDISPAFGLNTPSLSLNFLNYRSTVPAVYASAEYDINSEWTVSAEARYQKDKVESISRASTVIGKTINNLLPRLTVRFKPSSTLSSYVNVARGVQPLSVNTSYANATNPNIKALFEALYPSIGVFVPQSKLDSVELGVKQQLGRNFQYALAVYDQKWHNRLSNSFVFNPPSCGNTFNTPACPLTASGAGLTIPNEARVRGLELTLDAQITPAWSAGAYVDLKRGTWTRFDGGNARQLTGNAVAFDGNELARNPKMTVTGNTVYRYAVNAGWSGYSRADVTYVGKRWESDFNFAKLDPYSRVDLRQGFEKKDVLLELFVKNLFNDRGWTSGNRSANLGLSPLLNFQQTGLLVTVQEARTVGARMRLSF